MSLPRLTGLLLGAGASYEAGMPLVWELTREIKAVTTAETLHIRNQVWRDRGTPYDDRVIADCIRILERPELHYENIIGYLETQLRRQRSPKLHNQYWGLYLWFINIVYGALYLRQIHNDPFFNVHLPFYDGLRSLAETNRPLWIFSLNHDLIIETLAARHALLLFNGFSSAEVSLPTRDKHGAIKGTLRAQVLTKQNIEKGALHFPNPPQQGIYLLKLHGSLDIFAYNDANDLLKLIPADAGERSAIATLKSANEDLFYAAPDMEGGKLRVVNEIAFADVEGQMQLLRRSVLAGAFKYDARSMHPLPRGLLDHFRTNINFVTNLVAIGYSFGDDHINKVVRDWLEFSAERRLEIVDPHMKEVPPGLRHVWPQVTLTNSTATEWLDAKAGIERSPSDLALKKGCAFLRTLDRKLVAEKWPAFQKQELERIQQALMAGITKFPLKPNGDIDTSSVGSPEEAGRALAAETLGHLDHWFERMQAYFEEPEKPK